MSKKDLELRVKWSKLMSILGKSLGKRPKDLNAVLFLIGIQELGKGVQEFTKEEGRKGQTAGFVIDQCFVIANEVALSLAALLGRAEQIVKVGGVVA